MNGTARNRKIYTVSKLTESIKALLETQYPFVWISGEISNAAKSPAGHFYFTLKDSVARIQAVIFKGQLRNLQFEPEDGLSITGLGRISVYPPRGAYQILFEYLEPKGIGALQIAFEKLKERLGDEGLFDEKHKKALPFLPQKISVITSPTGAVIHDIIKIARGRFANIPIQVVPVSVQGLDAEDEINLAFQIVNARLDSDLIILARGGGSIEDLAAFNSETVARAIFASRIPVISAVGHETDFTIADFVADLRAPTPSAAAELALPLRRELKDRLTSLCLGLKTGLKHHVTTLRTELNERKKRLIDPKKRIGDLRLAIDDLGERLLRALSFQKDHTRERLYWWRDRLHANAPLQRISGKKEEVDKLLASLSKYIDIFYNNKSKALDDLTQKLHVLSPRSILSRGYSITRTMPDAVIVRDPSSVSTGQALEVMVEKGSITVKVQKT